MQAAPYPQDEAERLIALRAMNILDSLPAPEFDALVRAASLACGTPISLISLIDADRQWFKANLGLPGLTETSREVSFCSHAILGPDLFEVEDASKDSRFADNPLVKGDPGIRFYAGAPLCLSDGSRVGTLCVIDRVVHHLTESQREILRCLACAAAHALEGRRALTTSQRFAQAITDNVPGLVAYWDRELICKFANRAYQDWFGKESHQIVGHSLQELLGDNLFSLTEPHARAALNGQRQDFERTLVKPSGEVGYTWAHYIPDVNADNKVDGIYVLGTDITTLKESEHRLQKATERLALASRSGGIGVWEYDLETEKLIWDQRMYEIYSVDATATNLDFEVWRSHVHPDDRSRAVAEVMSAINGDMNFDSEFRIVTREGEVRYIKGSGVVERDSAGRAVSMIGVNIDISSIKRIEDRLGELLVLNQKIITECPVGIVVYSGSGECLIVNQAYAGILGRTVEDIMKENFHALASWQSSGLLDQALSALTSNTNIRTTAHHIAPSGREIWADVHFLPFSLSGKPHLMCIKTDVTTWHLAEEALNQAKSAAEQTNRAKSEFLANMSHEIRTPMNAILGLAHLLERSSLNPQQRDSVTKITIAGRTLLSIINDILDFSRVEAGRLELDRSAFWMDDLLDAVSTIMSSNASNKDLELIVSADADVPVGVIGDGLRLQQVLINLAGNAIKFTEKGEVVLRVQKVGLQGGKIVLRFSVRDTGIGISTEAQSSIFDAFEQADNSTTRIYGGSGLGLAISKKLIDLMGGEIGVESKLGVGSMFWFTVPLDMNIQSRELMGGGDRLHVLIADDHETAREVIALAAASLGWTAEIVGSGPEALKMAEQRITENRPFDGLILDWKMPDLDGLEVTRRVRDIWPSDHSPIVIMVTAFNREVFLREQGADTVDAILVKPVCASALFNAVMEARAQRAGGVDKLIEDFPRLSDGPRLSGVHLLLVEDNSINQDVARQVLELEGAKVTIASNGRQAVDLVAGVGGAFDVVLMDIHMPEMDGYQATEQIRNKLGRTDLPIIALTAGAFSSERERARQAGMSDFIAKPFDVDMMVHTIRQHAIATIPVHAPSRNSMDEATLSLTPEIAGIDMRQAAARLGGDKNLFLSLLTRLEQQFADVVELTREDLATGRTDQAAIRLHTLRGAAGNISASALATEASALEIAIRENRESDVPRLLDTLERILSGLIDAIRHISDAEKIPAPSLQQHQMTDVEILALLDALDSRNGAAVKDFGRLRASLAAAYGNEAIEAVEISIENLKFSDAAQRLRKCIKHL